MANANHLLLGPGGTSGKVVRSFTDLANEVMRAASTIDEATRFADEIIQRR